MSAAATTIVVCFHGNIRFMLTHRRRDGADFFQRGTFPSFAVFATGDTQQFAEYVAGKVWHIGRS
jgi:hypothetical protein